MDGDGDGVAGADVGAVGPAPPLIVDHDATSVVIRQHRRQLAAQGAAIAAVQGQVDDHGVALSSVEAHVEGASTALRQQQRLSTVLSSRVEEHDVALTSVEARVDEASIALVHQQRLSSALSSRVDEHGAALTLVEAQVDETSLALSHQQRLSSSLSSRVDDVQNHQAAAAVAMQEQRLQTAVLTSQAAATGASVVATQGRVVLLEAGHAELAVQYGGVADRVDDHDSRIVALEHHDGRVLGPVPFPSHILRRSDATTPTPGTRSSPSLPVFVGRDAQLDQLRAAFERAAERGVGMRHAVVGLGGVGKTQLVKEYVSRWGASYPRGVLWLEADSMSSLYGGYRAVLSQLKLFDGSVDDCVDSDGTAMRRVHAWLCGGGGWLLVVDNVDKPEMLRDGGVDIPVVAGSHVLVTSRARGADRLRALGIVAGDDGVGVGGGAACDVMSLGTLSASASLAMMCRLVWREDFDDVDSTAAGVTRDAAAWLRAKAGNLECDAGVWVCGDSCLSGLPLSLRQAASVMRESGYGFVWFRQQFESMPMRAIDGASASAGAGAATDVRSWLESCGLSSIYAAVMSDLGVASLHDLSELEKDAVMQMPGLSTLDRRRLWGAVERQLQSQRVARDAVTRTFALSAGAVRSIGGGVGDAALAVLVAVGALGRGSSVSAWVLLHVCASMCEEGVGGIGDVLWRREAHDDAAPHSAAPLSMWSRLWRRVFGGGIDDSQAARMRRDGVVSAASLRALRDVVGVLERHSLVDVVDVDSSVSGSVTVSSLGLGAMCFSVSAHRLVCAWAVDDAMARGLWRGVVSGCMRGVLVGALSDHFAVNDDDAGLPVCESVWWCVESAVRLSGRSDLGGGDGVGDVSNELESMVRGALSACGDDDGHWWRLASYLQFRGLYGASVDVHRHLLATYKSRRGDAHPDTLPCVVNMATVLRQQGRFAEALALYEQALAGLRSAHGDAHPDTLACMANMAVVLDDQGKHAEALALSEQALSGRRSALGDAHPDTLTCMMDMATVFRRQGKHAEALALCEQALSGRRSALGATHPDTLRCMMDMATVLRRQGKHAEALALCEQALSGLRSALGDAHPDTLRCRMDMATVFRRQGKHAEALALYVQTLSGLRPALGDAHPSTLRCMRNMAIVPQQQGKHAEALALYEQALSGLLSALGDAHPDTLTCMYNIAGLWYSQGRHAEALERFQIVLSGRVQCLGRDHPLTLDCQRAVAVAGRASERQASRVVSQ